MKQNRIRPVLGAMVDINVDASNHLRTQELPFVITSVATAAPKLNVCNGWKEKSFSLEIETQNYLKITTDRQGDVKH